jgi:F-box/leucine-rich repeat protein 2/20
MGGGFIRSLDFAGHVHLLSETLLDVTDNLCLKPAPLGTVPYTQLTAINLQGCSALTTRSLHHLLIRSRSLQNLSLKGLGAVTNTTCDVLAVYCPQLMTLDMSRCSNMDADGIRCLATAAIARGEHLLLKELRLSGLKHANDAMMHTLGKAAPYLEVLDLSYVRQLHNSALEAFVSCEMDEEHLGVETIWLTAREAGRDTNDSNNYRRRVTRLRHLSVSSCVLLTDIACSNLAHSVPQLEFLEMASIGAELKDDGLIKLLNTTPFIRRLDLEDASDISDSVIAAITPASVPDSPARLTMPLTSEAEPEPGHALEQLVISYASNVTDDALLALIRSCTRLTVLEVDNTRMGADVLKEFVLLSSKRQMVDSKIVAIDCRGIGESVVKDLSGSTRPRKGWRAYDARKLKYLDGRDDDLKVGQDECDEKRVVLKTFYSWQTVDAVRSAREKRRKSTLRRAANDSNGSMTDSDDFSGRATRWWSPGTRRPTGSGAGLPPTMPEMNNDGCRIM